MKKEKKNKPEKKKTKIENKEKVGTRIVNTIKKRWLISGTNTILLIGILVAITILINSIVQSLELTPIDCTSNKQYTLTEESKERIKDIEDNINIYVVGFTDQDAEYNLLKQYNKVKNNINVEIINTDERIDIAEKYQLTDEYNVIVVENGERSNIITSDELYTTDADWNTVDVTEEKITSAILKVTSKEIPKIYFLAGYSNYSLEYDGGMYGLSQYLENEVLEYEELNMLTVGSIPEDCKTLVITTPTKDFDELTTTEILKYIQNGGNILWLNDAYGTKIDLPNVNKILAEYAVNPFETGYVYETDTNRIVLNIGSCIVEDLTGYTDIDKNLKSTILLNSTKININEDKLDEKNVEKEDIITSSEDSYYRKDVSNESISTDGDEQGGFLLASLITKTIENEEQKEEDTETENEDENKIQSKLMIIGNNLFVSDSQLASNIYPMIYLENNKDLALNSLAHLTEQESGITIRKAYTATSSFTATDGDKKIIMEVIFAIPIIIIIIGIIVWQKRRRKK